MIAAAASRVRDRAPSWTLVVATGATAAYLALAASIALGLTASIDLAVMRWSQSFASHPLDVIANAHTLVGHLYLTLPLAAGLSLVLQRRFGGWAGLAALAILATGAIELAFKLGLHHPSPPAEFVRALTDALKVHGPANAFPSGHVARITFLSTLAAGLSPSPWVRLGATLMVVTAVYLRMYIGDHWISDTLGGAALGLAVGAAAVAWVHVTRRT